MFSPPGRSILITSAPDSASISVANGPGRSVVKSRTRMPESGCMTCLPANMPSLRPNRPLGAVFALF
jgi:hypothetical protein